MASSSSSHLPYLSVVAASRNDDHGGDPLVRTQIFINCFARQCEKYKLPAELILVDWNPVEGRLGLAGMLQLPAEASYCSARVITVPAVLHNRFKYADRLAFFQMIAKNAGIRRARGQFILATNIDIIFSDELMRYLSRQQLDATKTYRVDRYDIQRDLPPNFSVEQTMQYAWTHPVRSNRRFQPRALAEHLYGEEKFKRHCVPDSKTCPKIDGFNVVAEDGTWSVRADRDQPIENLHSNACGDFTLLSRQGWDSITGYPEFEAFSMNIDSVGLASAHCAGFTEVALLPPCVCFHIEHSLGSGWTPEGEKKLFERLNKSAILNPEWHVLTPLLNSMRAGQKATALNGPAWGLAEFDLSEEPLLPGRMSSASPRPHDYLVPAGLAVCSLRPEFDLDRLTLWQDRHNDPSDRLNKIIEDTRAALKHAENYLREVGQDRDNQLAALVEYGVNMKRMEAYILSIEKDREERLATIHVYQEKLKQAYADHAQNVAYIERMHAEIAAHVKVSADKDAIIASLAEQLRIASAANNPPTAP